MTAIWRNDGSGWHLLASSGFPAEAALHTLVEEAPHILPLAGTPSLVIVGREVQLGNGYADLIAVEPSGRLAVIEVKLAKNSEARRAVVAQVLTYAAYLRGMEVDTLEQVVLGSHLQKRGYDSLAQAISSNDQQGAFDPAAFSQGLAESLSRGRFRLVFVLDAAPPELARLVGYLEAITDGLLIDLITVTAYDVNGSQILVPQRIEDEPQNGESPALPPTTASHGLLVEGPADFIASIEQAPAQAQQLLRHLCDWAISLEHEKLVKLSTYHGKNTITLLPRLLVENVGLVTIYNFNGARLQFWRSVFERRAPHSLAVIERIIAPTPVGNGNWTSAISDDLLAALTDAYREASSSPYPS